MHPEPPSILTRAGRGGSPIVTANQRHLILFRRSARFPGGYRPVPHAAAGRDACGVDPAAAVKLTAARRHSVRRPAASDGAPGYFTDAERRFPVPPRSRLVGAIACGHRAVAPRGWCRSHRVSVRRITCGSGQPDGRRGFRSQRHTPSRSSTHRHQARRTYDPDRDRFPADRARPGYYAELCSAADISTHAHRKGAAPLREETGFALQVNNHVWSLEHADAERDPPPCPFVERRARVLAWFDWKGRMT
jgi:hypothetical protein